MKGREGASPTKEAMCGSNERGPQQPRNAKCQHEVDHQWMLPHPPFPGGRRCGWGSGHGKSHHPSPFWDATEPTNCLVADKKDRARLTWTGADWSDVASLPLPSDGPMS